MHIDFVHDYFTQFRGAERVIEELYDIYATNAQHVHTSMVSPNNLAKHMHSWQVTTSNVGTHALGKPTHRISLQLYPRAFHQLGTALTLVDVVIADTNAWAHHAATVLLRPFCQSPARFLHDDEHYRGATAFPPLAARASTPLLDWLRQQDAAAQQRPDRKIASSLSDQRRIRDVWDRKSTAIHSPVLTTQFPLMRTASRLVVSGRLASGAPHMMNRAIIVANVNRFDSRHFRVRIRNESGDIVSIRMS
jgi:hypothetical protein